MIEFSAISYFESRVAALKDVKRGVYSTVDEEVKAAFRGCVDEKENGTLVKIML